MRTRTPEFLKKRSRLFTISKTFDPNQKVLLYNSRQHLFPCKLWSRWTGLYIVQTTFSHRAIKIKNPMSGNIFKVNSQCLKPFLDNFASEEVVKKLVYPVYQDPSIFNLIHRIEYDFFLNWLVFIFTLSS